jgi:hypothetical protein
MSGSGNYPYGDMRPPDGTSAYQRWCAHHATRVDTLAQQIAKPQIRERLVRIAETWRRLSVGGRS